MWSMCDVPLGSHTLVGSNVDGVCDGLVADGQSQVCNCTRAVFLHQDVLGFEVTVGDPRLTWAMKRGFTSLHHSCLLITSSLC